MFMIAAVISIAILVFLYLNHSGNNQTVSSNPNFITNFNHKVVTFGGNFTLTKHDGTEFTFSSLKGKPTLLYFGFTHCPDFCPASLQVMDAVSNKIDVNRVFVSVDPERDTQKVLKEYVSLYKEGLIGLTGTLEQTDAVAKQWYVYYGFNKKDETDQDYLVDHTTYLYLTDKEGKIVSLIRPEATPDEIVEFINENVK